MQFTEPVTLCNDDIDGRGLLWDQNDGRGLLWDQNDARTVKYIYTIFPRIVRALRIDRALE